MGAFASRRGQAPTYDTPLGPREAQFQQWQGHLPPNLQNTGDYDLRGAFLGNAHAASNGHLTDTWKKPNHMTFSSDSQYSNPAQMGGQWAGDDKSGWGFWASPFNLQQHPATELADYFRQYEPDSTVVLPINYSLPRR
jgi:hypothetical protein